MKIWGKSIIIVALVAVSISAQAQMYNSMRNVHPSDPSKLSYIQKMEDTLVFLADSMLHTPVTDARIDGSYAFIKGMKRFLETRESFEYVPTKLKKRISIIQPDDKRFKIYSWEVVRSNVEVRYYGALQLPDGSYQPLIDASDQVLRGAEDSTFFNMRWYGAYYYNILQRKIGEQDAYFLLGYNGNAINGDKKIVDAFGFDRKGRAIFGAPIFSLSENKNRVTRMRFILNYQKGAKVSMNYDKERNMIIYDHCESSVGDINKKNTYVPDGTYDGLKWDGRYWQQYLNVVKIQATPAGQAPLVKPIKN